MIFSSDESKLKMNHSPWFAELRVSCKRSTWLWSCCGCSSRQYQDIWCWGSCRLFHAADPVLALYRHPTEPAKISRARYNQQRKWRRFGSEKRTRILIWPLVFKENCDTIVFFKVTKFINIGAWRIDCFLSLKFQFTVIFIKWILTVISISILSFDTNSWKTGNSCIQFT